MMISVRRKMLHDLSRRRVVLSARFARGLSHYNETNLLLQSNNKASSNVEAKAAIMRSFHGLTNNGSKPTISTQCRLFGTQDRDENNDGDSTFPVDKTRSDSVKYSLANRRRKQALHNINDQTWNKHFNSFKEWWTTVLKQQRKSNNNNNNNSSDNETSQDIDSSNNSNSAYAMNSIYTIPQDRFLREWLRRNRALYKQRVAGASNSLNDDRVAKLRELDYPILHYQMRWETQLSHLVDFIKKNGAFPHDLHDLPHGSKLSEDERRLLQWCQRQRQDYREYNAYIQAHGKENKDIKHLTYKNMQPSIEERIKRLEQIGFQWDPLQENWMAQYKKLILYRDEFGDCLVPNTGNELSNWVHTQRQQYRPESSGQLPPTRQKLLEDLGFEWDAREALWQKRYNEYVEFAESVGRLGHIPSRKENCPLNNWCHYQRAQMKNFVNGKQTTMTRSRMEKLLRVGIQIPNTTAKKSSKAKNRT